MRHGIKTEDQSTGNSDEKERLELRHSRGEGGDLFKGERWIIGEEEVGREV